MFADLSDLVALEGYTLILVAEPQDHPDAKGDPDPSASVVLLTRKRLASTGIGLDFGSIYSAAHEICEDYWGNSHSEELWMDQCNLLARWCAALAGNEVDPESMFT